MNNTITFITEAALQFGQTVNAFVDSVITCQEQIFASCSAYFMYAWSCIWCGIAFLRSLVEIPTQMRNTTANKYVLYQERTWEVRFLPSALISQGSDRTAQLYAQVGQAPSQLRGIFEFSDY